MVTFVCLSDCARGCPEIWSNILGKSVGMFLDEINMWLSD